MTKHLSLFVFLLVPFFGVVGQDTVTSAESSQSFTLLSKPEVRIPSEVRKSGLGGLLRARVTLDSAGNVLSVDEISGPGAVCQHVDREDVRSLREAVRESALKSHFAPPTNSAVYPVSSTAVLTFEVKGDRESLENALISGYDLPANSKDDRHFSASTSPDDKGPVKTTGAAVADPAAGASSGNTPETLSGGVLNGKASELPRPAYPPAARAVRASGSVPVQVLIDENGKVFLARAKGGHPLLRIASVNAACAARFQQTLLSGKPVKVSGIITYNFVP